MQIRLSFQNLPVYPYFQKFHWRTRIVCILAGCALTLFLFKKFISFYTDNTPPPPPGPAARVITTLPPAPATTAIPRPAATPPRSPAAAAAVIDPPSDSIDPQLLHYLQEALNLVSQEFFSEKLGTQLEGFKARGITTRSDLECLALSQFNVDIDKFDETIKTIQVNPQNPQLRGVNNQISCVAEDIQEFMGKFTKTNNLIQDICVSSQQREFDLSNDIASMQNNLANLRNACSNPNVRNPEIIQQNKDNLSAIFTQIQELDRKRQICWLKGYLLQQDLLGFWNRYANDPAKRSLSVYMGVENIPPEELFQLGR